MRYDTDGGDGARPTGGFVESVESIPSVQFVEQIESSRSNPPVWNLAPVNSIGFYLQRDRARQRSEATFAQHQSDWRTGENQFG
jgi:hypothetical protein